MQALMLLLLPAALAAQQSATVSVDRANVRQAADVESSIVSTIRKGTVVEVLERTDTWSRVSAGKSIGWVRTSTLLFTASASAEARRTGTPVVATAEKPSRPASAIAEPARTPPSTRTAPPSAGRSTPETAKAMSAAGPASVELPPRGLSVGFTDLTATAGLGAANSGLAIGGRVERIIRRISIGNGLLGVQVGTDLYAVPNLATYTNLGATANYHFNLGNPALDVFVGAGLFYLVVTCDDLVIGGGASIPIPCGNLGGAGPMGRVGARYFISRKLALYGELSGGTSVMNAGISYRFR